MPKRLIHWFRRDLRLHDNTALAAACAEGADIIPVFIFDRRILERPDTGAARVAFLLDALRDLDARLRERGGYLVVREGEPVETLERLLDETGAEGVFFNRDVEPFARERDRRVTERLTGRGARIESFQDMMLHGPSEVLTQARTPYTVFTPYKRTALALPVASALPAPERLQTPPGIPSQPLPTLAELNFQTNANLPIGGETRGLELLDAFAASDLDRYADRRDLPAIEGTSRLSPYLRFGCVSPRRAFHLARTRAAGASDDALKGIDTWISELLWRDFYQQILFHFPHVETGAFKRPLDNLAWEDNDDFFDRWCRGLTGFPIVDAGMRQLNETGWMHNRVRMIVASFLTKDLLIDWRRGERYFMLRLVDGDLAANNGGWQWAASTGTDAQPYFRIFNPVSQGQKFDPKGEYVRRYVPELKSVPDKWIHAPWELPRDYQPQFRCVIGRDYPAPIVDHGKQRVKALAMFKKVESAS